MTNLIKLSIPLVDRKSKNSVCTLKQKNSARINHELLIFLIEFALIMLLCVIHSMSAGHYVDFFPINGTFQNYNPVRRLLSGQIPYRDFQDYLGLGHLYIGTITTVLFGGDYQGSLLAFSFLSFAGLAMLSFMVSFAISGKKEISAGLTGIFLFLVLTQPLIFKGALAGSEDILNALDSSLRTGNSARFVRGMILPISTFGVYLWVKLHSLLNEKIKSKKISSILLYVGVGIVAGFCLPWSNDYGISCWLCLAIMIFWVSLSRERSFITSAKYTCIAIIASLLAVFVAVELFTFGHFFEWFSNTFSTGGYQGWYYNSAKSFFIYDVDFSTIMLLQAGLVLLYLAKLFGSNGSAWAVQRYGVLAFANMTCFCAVNEYKILSGGEAREVALSVLFFDIVLEVIFLFPFAKLGKIRAKKILALVSIVLTVAWAIPSIKDEFLFLFSDDKGGVYIEQLGGNATLLGNDLLKTDAFLNGDDFFATYASAQEVVSNTFQPSGTDYIIHVLGDKQRQAYLSAFLNGNFKYTATINEAFTDWEYWVQRANWFFYRELYAGWHPVYANTYELYWERNEDSETSSVQTGFHVYTEAVDDTTQKIIVQCDDALNGVADTYLDYTTPKKDNTFAKMTIQTLLNVLNTGTVYASGGAYFDSNYLRGESAEYIPIPVVNGYGEVTITSSPQQSTFLSVHQVTCSRIFTVSSDYLVFDSIENIEGKTTIVMTNTEKNLNASNGVTNIEYNNHEYSVSNVRHDEDFIYFTIDGDVERGTSNVLHLKH